MPVTTDLYLQAEKSCFPLVLNLSNQVPDIPFLHEKEKQHLKGLTYERRIKSYLLGRYAAKQAVSQFVGVDDLTQIHIENGIFNQPIVSGYDIQISLAHSDNLAVAIAFDPRVLIGIDVEKRNRIVEFELTEDEQALGRDPLLLWTMKESLSKVLKTGLTVPLEILEVKEINEKQGMFSSTFTHFFQYQTLSWLWPDYAFSITYPKNTQIMQSRKSSSDFFSSESLQNALYSQFENRCSP